MGLSETVLLGAIAGFTIYLGLPVARLKTPKPGVQAFLNAVATGILVFLLWDILGKAREPIDAAMDAARQGDAAEFSGLLAVFVVGFGVGLIGLVYVDRVLARREKSSLRASASKLSVMIASGIGLHNFSEGLAIGQSSGTGAIAFATILVIGFALHNTTEGFGIAAPFAATGSIPDWSFLGVLGLIGGGPTFVGAIVGYSIQSTFVFVLCLALAAGSILYVIAELIHVGRRFAMPELAMWGAFIGFCFGFGTDLLLTWAGV